MENKNKEVRMNKKMGQMPIAGMIIFITVGLIIGIVVFQIIFTLIDDQTSTLGVADDQFTASNNTCVQVTNKCIVLGSGVIENATGAQVETNNFTECQVNNPDKLNGFSLNPNGGGTGFDGVAVNATYSEVSCSFIPGGTTQTVLNLLPLLLAVALIVFVTGFIVLKK